MFNALFQTGHGRLEDQNNLFTALRIVFAIVVLYSHALMIILGKPFESAWAQSIDFIAHRCLDGFFILSGYMLTASVMNGTGIGAYTRARILRIFPGLIVTVLLLWLVVGPLFSALPSAQYWADPQTWAFPALLLSQADPLAGLPGVFEGSPVGGAANGPLWTIRYELLAYVGLGLLAVLGLMRKTAMVLAWAVLAILASVAYAQFGYTGPGDATIGSLARFAPAFMIGGAFYAARDEISLTPGFVFLSIAATLASIGTAIFPILLQLATAWTVLWLGYVKIPGRTGRVLRGVEDVSYGVYILHWPIGMMLFALMPGLTTTALFALMLPLSVLAGWILRVVVEKPALRFKRKHVSTSRASTGIL